MIDKDQGHMTVEIWWLTMTADDLFMSFCIPPFYPNRAMLRSLRPCCFHQTLRRFYSAINKTTLDLPDKVPFQLTREQWALGSCLYYAHNQWTNVLTFFLRTHRRQQTNAVHVWLDQDSRDKQYPSSTWKHLWVRKKLVEKGGMHTDNYIQ